MSASREIEARLRETAGKLLHDRKVSLVLGYEKASLPFRTTPLFLTREEEVERLSWNPFCSANLTVYLPRLLKAAASAEKGKASPPAPTIAVVVKGCDARAAVTLLAERQIARENVVLIGVACRGIVDRRKAEKALGEHETLGAGEGERGDIRAVVEDGTEISLSRQDLLADACLECGFSVPSVCDVTLGLQDTQKIKEKSDGMPEMPELFRDGPEALRARVAEIEARPLDARWAGFTEAVGACIRCNACRQACPLCYCTTCVFDRERPRWIGAGSEPTDIMLFHLVRALHLAGRCIGCGACERACPLGIDVRILQRKLTVAIEDLFGYRPGEAIDAKPVLASFSMDDTQDFILEP